MARPKNKPTLKLPKLKRFKPKPMKAKVSSGLKKASTYFRKFK